MRVLVAGATGVLGRAALPALLRAGHDVSGTSRTADKDALVRGLGAAPVRADILDRDAMARAARGTDAVIHLATHIPSASDDALGWRENDRVRVEGTRNLLAAASAAGARAYVQQSITFPYGDHGDEWIDESAPFGAGPYESAIEMERLVRESGLAWTILRGGSLYGPGTANSERWRRAVSHGPPTLDGDGSSFLSLIHADDFAQAIVRSLDAAAEHETFNVVDDEPVRQRELLAFLAQRAGAAPPRGGGGPRAASQRVSNARIRRMLAFHPRYPTFREGAP